MKVGFVGLGKMGLPIAVSMAWMDHDVMGTDICRERMSVHPQPYQETGPDGKGNFNVHLAASRIRFGDLSTVLAHGEIVFVAVQTPHKPQYEGITRLPDERVDFDYTYLIEVVRDIVSEAKTPVIVVIMSTVLPGTTRRCLLPIADENSNVSLVYSPSFIAMGTTMRDFLRPEFVLVGSDNSESARAVKRFYKTISSDPVRMMTIESAELAKVTYNTFITMKIAFANTVMELCDEFERADCDDVTGALKLSDRRIVSTAYMDGGLGDGGGCHPRDNIALSWLARETDLSYDMFDAMMTCREKQAERLADILYAYHIAKRLPVFILGTAFKPETNLTVGSPALLVAALLQELFDSNAKTAGESAFLIDDSVGTEIKESKVFTLPGVYLIGCRHARYSTFTFADGSVVIDPHRYIYADEDAKYEIRRLGSGHKIV